MTSNDPILKIIHCNTNLRILVFELAANRHTTKDTTLGKVLMMGNFHVNYSNMKDDKYECSKCIAFGRLFE